VTQLPNKVRVVYIRDTVNPDRVLTIAHRLNDDNITVTYGVSINRPPEWVTGYTSKKSKDMYYSPGDRFNRKKGREIALGRMSADRSGITIPLEAGTTALVTCLKHLQTEHANRRIRRIAQTEYEYIASTQRGLNWLQRHGCGTCSDCFSCDDEDESEEEGLEHLKAAKTMPPNCS
jgi:hypothetical protein